MAEQETLNRMQGVELTEIFPRVHYRGLSSSRAAAARERLPRNSIRPLRWREEVEGEAVAWEGECEVLKRDMATTKR